MVGIEAGNTGEVQEVGSIRLSRAAFLEGIFIFASSGLFRVIFIESQAFSLRTGDGHFRVVSCVKFIIN